MLHGIFSVNPCEECCGIISVKQCRYWHSFTRGGRINMIQRLFACDSAQSNCLQAAALFFLVQANIRSAACPSFDARLAKMCTLWVSLMTTRNPLPQSAAFRYFIQAIFNSCRQMCC